MTDQTKAYSCAGKIYLPPIDSSVAQFWCNLGYDSTDGYKIPPYIYQFQGVCTSESFNSLMNDVKLIFEKNARRFTVIIRRRQGFEDALEKVLRHHQRRVNEDGKPAWPPKSLRWAYGTPEAIDPYRAYDNSGELLVCAVNSHGRMEDMNAWPPPFYNIIITIPPAIYSQVRARWAVGRELSFQKDFNDRSVTVIVKNPAFGIAYDPPSHLSRGKSIVFPTKDGRPLSEQPNPLGRKIDRASSTQRPSSSSALYDRKPANNLSNLKKGESTRTPEPSSARPKSAIKSKSEKPFRSGNPRPESKGSKIKSPRSPINSTNIDPEHDVITPESRSCAGRIFLSPKGAKSSQFWINIGYDSSDGYAFPEWIPQFQSICSKQQYDALMDDVRTYFERNCRSTCCTLYIRHRESFDRGLERVLREHQRVVHDAKEVANGGTFFWKPGSLKYAYGVPVPIEPYKAYDSKGNVLITEVDVGGEYVETVAWPPPYYNIIFVIPPKVLERVRSTWPGENPSPQSLKKRGSLSPIRLSMELVRTMTGIRTPEETDI